MCQTFDEGLNFYDVKLIDNYKITPENEDKDIKTPVVIEMDNDMTLFYKLCKTKWHMMDEDIKLSEVQALDSSDPYLDEDPNKSCAAMEYSDAFVMIAHECVYSFNTVAFQDVHGEDGSAGY